MPKGKRRSLEERLGKRLFLPQNRLHGNYVSNSNPGRSRRIYFLEIFLLAIQRSAHSSVTFRYVATRVCRLGVWKKAFFAIPKFLAACFSDLFLQKSMARDRGVRGRVCSRSNLFLKGCYLRGHISGGSPRMVTISSFPCIAFG